MRGLFLCLLLVCTICPPKQAEADMVCIPGPAIGCVDLQTVIWTKTGEGVADGTHAFWVYSQFVSGMAVLAPAYTGIHVRFAQVVSGFGDNPVTCRTVAAPSGMTTEAGPLECALGTNVLFPSIQADGSWSTTSSPSQKS